jgi:uncharacterized protein YciI
MVRAWYKATMAMFHVVLHRSGLQYVHAKPLEEQSRWDEHAAFMDGLVEDGFIVLGGPLSDEHRVVHAVEAASEDDVRATLACDPWSETHLVVAAIEPWTIRLDSRRVQPRLRLQSVQRSDGEPELPHPQVVRDR